MVVALEFHRKVRIRACTKFQEAHLTMGFFYDQNFKMNNSGNNTWWWQMLLR